MHIDTELEPCASAGDMPLEAKYQSTQIARAALAGFQLVRMADGSWVASRRGMVAALDGADAVDAFLRRVGAPA